MMSRRKGLAVLALVVTFSWFGGWEPVPAPESVVPAMLAVDVAEAAPAHAPAPIAFVPLSTLGDPDGFSDGPGGDPDGTPPDSTKDDSRTVRRASRGLGAVAQALLDWLTRLL